MTFNEALLKAGNEVTRTRKALSLKEFHEEVQSLVVLFHDGKYGIMTVNKWRKELYQPVVIVALGSADHFGG